MLKMGVLGLVKLVGSGWDFLPCYSLLANVSEYKRKTFVLS